jgi:hypothetical protein
VTLNHRVGGSSPSPPTYDGKPEKRVSGNFKWLVGTKPRFGRQRVSNHLSWQV